MANKHCGLADLQPGGSKNRRSAFKLHSFVRPAGDTSPTAKGSEIVQKSF